MKNWFFVMLVGAVFLSGCATVVVKDEPQKTVVVLSEKEIAIERFNTKISRAFAQFRCPDKSFLEYSGIEAGFATIFASEESRREWIRKIYNLTQHFSDGSVYIGEIKSQQKFGLYDEQEEFYLFVFSAEERREYSFRRKSNSLGCEETKKERFVRELTGG